MTRLGGRSTRKAATRPSRFLVATHGRRHAKRRQSRSVCLTSTERYDETAMVVMPRIAAVIRQLARPEPKPG